MRDSFLCDNLEKEILFKKNMYGKNIKRTCLIGCLSSLQKSKLAKLISSDMKKSIKNLFLIPATIQISKKKLIHT